MFHRFETESITFSCIASGTDVSLKWYFNGSPLSVNTSTLELTDLSPNDMGIYQCMWTSFFEDEFNSTSWALTVQTPGIETYTN